ARSLGRGGGRMARARRGRLLMHDGARVRARQQEGERVTDAVGAVQRPGEGGRVMAARVQGDVQEGQPRRGQQPQRHLLRRRERHPVPGHVPRHEGGADGRARVEGQRG
ncbi:hypothetical protein DC043_15490, partial [Enterococcus faecalis]